ncbi:MAG TPA: hypothetical protein VD887_05230 [Allosphingosinicella sp.]|nr:hypothetical protein [Allosphingosinicella sp.]
MSTLAVACATASNLDIVTDQTSERLHECLLQKNQDAVFDAYLGDEGDLPVPRSPDEHELFEVLLAFACDTSELDAQRLAEMGSDRAPIHLLKERLKEHAKSVGPMDPGPERKQKMEEEIYAILEKWEQDRANMSDFWSRFFGLGQIDNAANFAKSMVRRVGRGAVAGLGFGGAAVGAMAGLGIGLISHGLKTGAGLRTRASTSPYRYLTIMQQAGVAFRSDWRLSNPRRVGRAGAS